jgi:hypothetical protein
MAAGTCEQRLDVLHERGPALVADGSRIRRLGARPRAPALEALEERRLLADDVRLLAETDFEAQGSEVPFRARGLERCGRGGERALQVHDGFRGAHGACRQREPLQHL